MDLLQLTMVAATLLCTLTAGIVLIFAVVVMPGIAQLEDRAFLRAFQVIDGVIQAGQPIFGLVWVGSLATLLAAVALVLARPEPSLYFPLISAAVVYVLGVQLPTFRINIPLNNVVKTLPTDSLTGAALATARSDFEPRWNRWNIVRTFAALATSILLLIALLRI